MADISKMTVEELSKLLGSMNNDKAVSDLKTQVADITGVAGGILSMPGEEPNLMQETIGGGLSGFSAAGPVGAVLGAGMGFINSGNRKAALEEQNRKRERDLLLASRVSPQYMQDGGKPEGVPDGITDLVPVQTEEGELFFDPNTLDILDTNADKKHKDMKDGEVTDLLPLGAEVFSDSLELDPKKLSEEDDFMGFGMSFYDETGKNVKLFKKKLSKIVGDKKDTFAGHANNIRDVFSTVDDEYDIFDQKTNAENKQQRLQYVSKLIALQTKERGEDLEPGIQAFGHGGRPMDMLEDGGRPDPELDSIMNVLINRNKSLDFVKRMKDPYALDPIKNEDGSHSTHEMAAEMDENGNWYVFPTIVNQNGKLKNLGRDAFSHALKTKEYIKAPSKKAALHLSKNYKNSNLGAGNFELQKFAYGGKVKKYQDGDNVTIEELMKYFKDEFGTLKEDVSNQVGSQISDYNNMYDRSRSRNSLGLMTDIFATVGQDPREDPFIETPYAIDERFRSTPIALQESQVSRINRSPISTGRDLIASGVNPADVPSMIADLQRNAVDATGNFYANENRTAADLREKKYAELSRIQAGNDARTVAAGNAERTNRNQTIAGIGRGVGNYLGNADAIDYSRTADINNIYNDYLNTKGSLIESESNLLSPMSYYNEALDDYDRRRQNIEDALYGGRKSPAGSTLGAGAGFNAGAASAAGKAVPGMSGPLSVLEIPRNQPNPRRSALPYPLRRYAQGESGNPEDFDFYQNNPDLWKFSEYGKRVPGMQRIDMMKNPRLRKLLLR